MSSRETACDCAPASAPASLRAGVRPTGMSGERLDAALKALASAPRRELLRIVAGHTAADGGCCDTDVCACTLADALVLAPSTISHHMAVLVRAGLVTASKRGLWVYYRLERDALAEVAGELASF